MPGNGAVARRHKMHDAQGIFRSEREWRMLFDGAGFALVASGRVGSRALSRRHTGFAQLDYLYQRWFVLRRRAALPSLAMREVQERACAHHGSHQG